MKCDTPFDAFMAEYKRRLSAFNARFPGLGYVNARPKALRQGLMAGLYADAFHSPAVRMTVHALGLAETPTALREYLNVRI